MLKTDLCYTILSDWKILLRTVKINFNVLSLIIFKVQCFSCLFISSIFNLRHLSIIISQSLQKYVSYNTQQQIEKQNVWKQLLKLKKLIHWCRLLYINLPSANFDSTSDLKNFLNFDLVIIWQGNTCAQFKKTFNRSPT